MTTLTTTLTNKLILLTSEGIGHGDESLGHVLLANFLRTIANRDEKPAAIVLMNGAVRLACPGADAFEAQEHLRELADAGVPVYACRTCLEAFGLVDRVQIGKIGGMAQFVEMMASYGVIAL